MNWCTISAAVPVEQALKNLSPHDLGLPRTEGWAHLPQELKVRANTFRTKGTHLFMLGQKVRSDQRVTLYSRFHFNLD